MESYFVTIRPSLAVYFGQLFLLGGEAVTTPTFQLGGAGSTPGRDI